MSRGKQNTKQVDIQQEEVKVVSRIVIDGVEYPLTKWNIDLANKYLLSGDESYLDKLINFSWGI